MLTNISEDFSRKQLSFYLNFAFYWSGISILENDKLAVSYLEKLKTIEMGKGY